VGTVEVNPINGWSGGPPPGRKDGVEVNSPVCKREVQVKEMSALQVDRMDINSLMGYKMEVVSQLV
jgi:hypothetical protein